MSAFSYTDWTVICNQGDCAASGRTDEIDRLDVTTAADVRRVLKARGWLVNIPNPSPGGWPPRLDYCPDHKGLELARRGREAIKRAEAERMAAESTEGVSDR